MKSVSVFLCSLLLSFLVLLGGCGKNEVITAPKDYIYRYEELPISREFKDGASFFTSGDNFYIYGSVWNENFTNSTLLLAQLDDNGNEIEKTAFSAPNGTTYSSLTGGGGGAFALKTVMPGGSDDSGDITAITPRALDSENSTETLIYLTELGMDGNEKWSVLLNDNLDINNSDSFFVYNLFSLPNDRLVVFAADKFALYNIDGSYLGLINLADLSDNNTGNFLTLKDGRALVYYYQGQSLIMRTYNPETVTMENEYVLPNNAGYYVYPGVDFDLLLADNNNVYGYNLGEEPIILMNFVDSDLNIFSINNVNAVRAGNFWGVIYDSIENRIYCAGFTKVPPEEVIDKIGLTLAGSYIDWDVKNKVVIFNKKVKNTAFH